MPKRKSAEKINYYKEKIKKLEEKSNRRRERRKIIQSDSSSSSNDNTDVMVPVEVEDILPRSEAEAMVEADCFQDASLEIPSNSVEQPEAVSQPELTQEYLQALGDAIEEEPQYGEDIHQDLAQRWLPILKKGLSKDSRENLIKLYLIPNNCKLLKAPSLNGEISAAITETLRLRDKKLENFQQQLGVGITAINKAMTLLLTDDDKIKSIKILSDATRILSDLHYQDSETRMKLLTPSLDKSILNIIDKNRDETLFVNNLSEKIKTAKIIEKQGLSIKKNVSLPKSAPSTSVTRPRQGNWTGPPRFPSNRGGRTAPQTRLTATTRRTTAASAPTTLRSSYSSKQRAPQSRRY